VNKDALILFLRYPEQGAVKTRLAKTLGAEMTYELYQCFLADLSRMAREVRAEKFIVYEGPEDSGFPDFPGIGLIRQRGEDMGRRMYFAFQDVFALGFERCVLIGSDSPDLPGEIIEKAFESLEANGAVIGPAFDGGYYLIGFFRNILSGQVFKNMPWSTDRVFTETMQRFRDNDISVHVLPRWRDMDTWEDIQALMKEYTQKDFGQSKTIRFLKEHGLNGEEDIVLSERYGAPADA